MQSRVTNRYNPDRFERITIALKVITNQGLQACGTVSVATNKDNL